jgi:radical SAM superfamily enzyme YgiQ (UPF0313 family)
MYVVNENEGMHYEGYCIRPPSEADSILLQVTLGCSHNKCTFCGAYKDKRFKIKDDNIILSDILFAAKYLRGEDRVFLMDGDALIIPQKMLLWIVGAYANTNKRAYGNFCRHPLFRMVMIRFSLIFLDSAVPKDMPWQT